MKVSKWYSMLLKTFFQTDKKLDHLNVGLLLKPPEKNYGNGKIFLENDVNWFKITKKY